jgi:hypothetical protein
MHRTLVEWEGHVESIKELSITKRFQKTFNGSSFEKLTPYGLFVAALEPVLNERKKNTILFVIGRKEGANVTYLAKLRAAREIGWTVRFIYNPPSGFRAA